MRFDARPKVLKSIEFKVYAPVLRQELLDFGSHVRIQRLCTGRCHSLVIIFNWRKAADDSELC
jgi:hypothetical protein